MIVESGSIPSGVPFASAPSGGWENVPALGETVFHLLESLLGERGLVLAQLAASVAALAALGADARRAGAASGGTALALVLAVAAALPAFLVARIQLFSLALFPLLLVLLRAESRAPSRRVWLLPPLFALWSNLHGAVLVGLAAAGAYLVLERARRDPLVALGTLLASALAVCATPALADTPDYYRGVLENEAARRGLGLWAPLSFSAPLDLVFVVVALVLVGLALAARPRLWELAVLAGLALLTVQTARSGVWLALAAAVPAATRVRGAAVVRPRVAAIIGAGLAAAAVAGIAKGPLPTGASSTLVELAVREARGTPILAEPVEAEQIALAGGTIWLGNPLDAFRPADQRLYLDWLEGAAAGDSAVARAPRIVVGSTGSDAELRLRGRPDLVRVGGDERAVVYRRRPS